jgi:hypothetical protein
MSVFYFHRFTDTPNTITKSRLQQFLFSCPSDIRILDTDLPKLQLRLYHGDQVRLRSSCGLPYVSQIRCLDLFVALTRLQREKQLSGTEKELEPDEEQEEMMMDQIIALMKNPNLEPMMGHEGDFEIDSAANIIANAKVSQQK